uniref:Tryptophan 2,3-dioxygenase n=1 Tax=Candidatus Kentrum sp. FW TaxID=2126338 RepID=A0A450RZ74_9GAMM|nr:MAG: tryptophan 2,3-dioxygenase [Candidatus Kentron sp. FW]VFJ54106.1 MAG: tryptophan 2,3-dioxygenase [Candidatus Kentron sp. FW]
MDVLQTMGPLSFLAFRDALGDASGLQSAQFRELEFVLGCKQPKVLHHHPEGSGRRQRLERRLTEPSLVDHFYDFLVSQGVEIPAVLRNKSLERPNEPNEAIQHALLRLYREKTGIRMLLESMTDFDQELQEWRYRHVKVVERTIGNKSGTGGTSGAEYLKRTLSQPVFPDLWEMRNRI